jgi:hypothetical protein
MPYRTAHIMASDATFVKLLPPARGKVRKGGESEYVMRQRPRNPRKKKSPFPRKGSSTKA